MATHPTNEPVHISRECPQEGGGGEGINVCSNCKEPGHFSRDCPQIGDGGDGEDDDIVCSNCNGLGHFSCECPFAGGGGGHGGSHTVTYRTDSTVFMPYDSLVRITADTPIEDVWTEEEVRQTVRNKRKLAFQAVSHCDVDSGRDFLTKALQGMLNLDLYGGCGGRSCDSNCYNTEMDNHLFYFAFENSVCPQYITEKFWRSLRKPTIPVPCRIFR
uniref:Fucosyltransferase n=1 Tax=Globodera pallida TaxID=36090 RepID=A0A183C591_GLOPA